MTRTEIPAQLLADIKNYLNITWDDNATDENSVALLRPVLCTLMAKAAVLSIMRRTARHAHYCLSIAGI